LHACTDLEEEFLLMKKLGLPTMLINSYDDVEEEVCGVDVENKYSFKAS
jgi:hypothetical protein